MGHKFKYTLIPLMLALLLVFTGCSQKPNNSGSSSTSSAVSESSSQSAEPQSRYDQIFDPSGDDGKLVVRFLYTATGTDTKSGDSTIIKTPDGKVMLVDGSAPETAGQIKKYLDALGITKIDAIVATHPHIDHIGGLTQIIYQYDVDKVYRSEMEYPTKTNQNFLKAIEDKGIETVILKDGMSFDFGETKVEVYSPVEGFEYPSTFPDSSTDFINNHSLVFKMTYKESSLLMTGDLYVTGETDLLKRHGDELQADILKMPHHGDSTSSSISFIKAVQPKVAVGMYDRLASLDTYKAYRNNDSLAYITAIDGCVMVVADGTRDYKIVTEKDRTSDFLK